MQYESDKTNVRAAKQCCSEQGRAGIECAEIMMQPIADKLNINELST
jgi:hypothetical protein